MSIRVRLYKAGDAEKIYSFFAEYTPYLRDASYWVWINRLWSEEGSIVSVVEDEAQKIIGHYAIVPRTFTNGKIDIKVGLGLHALVHPNYRDQVSIFEIANVAYKEAARLNIQFIYGFPNSNYRLIQEKIERWRKVEVFSAFEKASFPVAGEAQMHYNWRIVKMGDFSCLFDVNSLLERNCSNKYRFKWSLPHIFNRYINDPQNLYECYNLYQEDRLVAFVVTKVYPSKIISGHIIDVILSDLDFGIEPFILEDFEKKFSTKVDKFILWSSMFETPNILQKSGYESTGHDTFFGIKVLNNDIPGQFEALFDFSRWHLVMGDSDAY